MITIPTVMLVCIALLFTVRSVKDITDSNVSASLLDTTKITVDLVHELQKERGMSASFIGARGLQFGPELAEQRALTDQKIQQYLANAKQDERTVKGRAELIRDLNKLDSIRRQVDLVDTNLGKVLKFYTLQVQRLIHEPMQLLSLIDNNYLLQDLTAIFTFAQLKERSGLQRAVFSNILASKMFTRDKQKRIYSLMAEEAAYQDSASSLILEKFVIRLNNFISGDLNQDVVKMREQIIADAHNGQFNIEPKVWFSLSTKRIGELRALEVSVIEDMANYIAVDINRQYKIVAAWMLLSGLVIVLTYLMWIALKSSRYQAKKIAQALRDIEQNSDLTKQIDVVSQDQLGRAANQFNKVVEKLAHDFDAISQLSVEALSATNDTVVAITQSDKNILQQRDETAIAASSVKQLSGSISGVSDRIGDTVTAINSAKECCKGGEKELRDVVGAIQQVAQKVDDLSTSINTLNGGVLNISNFIEVIQSVAEQTNLLALNAAIEAARAGEQGRGFAVVADEVRNLAKRVQEATEEISDIIMSLQSDSQEATQKIKGGQEQTSNAVVMVENINTVINEIITSVDSIDSMAKNINADAREQSVVTSDVAKNVSYIDQMSEENIQGTKEISRAAKHLFNTNQKLLGLINQYDFSRDKKYSIPQKWQERAASLS